jgi:hypothetical protein
MSSTYAQRWLRWCSLVGAFGVGFSFLLWPLHDILLLWGTGFTSAILLLALAVHSPDDDIDWLRNARLAGLFSAGVLAGAALADVSGSLAVLLALVVAISSPWVVARVGARPKGALGSGPPVSPLLEHRPTPLPDGEEVLRAMSNHDLCLLWRRTFVRLQQAADGRELVDVVAVRQSLLDEMDRRCPSALSAWIASGGRAASGPDRFLHDEIR